MRKINLFGKSVSIMAIMLIAFAGLGSTALVGYISNTVQVNVEVTSPIEQSISLDGINFQIEPITFTPTTGGGTITFYTKTENVADVPITGFVKNILANTGITCDDFKSVLATTNGDGPYDLIDLGLCSPDETDTVIFSYGRPDVLTWAVGQVDITTIVVTFKLDALGTYNFTSQAVPVEIIVTPMI